MTSINDSNSPLAKSKLIVMTKLGGLSLAEATLVDELLAQGFSVTEIIARIRADRQKAIERPESEFERERGG